MIQWKKLTVGYFSFALVEFKIYKYLRGYLATTKRQLQDLC